VAPSWAASRKTGGAGARALLRRGKIDEIGQTARAESAVLFVSDDPLSPIQERNISQALGIKVIDRTALILDIFAQRARTSEGKLQVELAQLTYLLPRLVGQWSTSSGWAADRHARTGRDAARVGPARDPPQGDADPPAARRRAGAPAPAAPGRRRSGVPVVALVGYTNAGKTTLLNRLAGSQLPPPTSSSSPRPGRARRGARRGTAFVLTDTVGFIRSCRTSWWPRSARRSRSWPTPTCCCTWSTRAIRRSTIT
jgi:GTP-binding protein HflX